MRLRINQIKARWADEGKRVTLDDIADGTGINRRTLDNIVAGRYNEIRYDYIDALCAYFGVTAGELIQAEPITLPLSLNIRPDRHGARVGERTKAPSASSGAERTAPAPSAPVVSQPAVAEPVEGASRPAVAEPVEAPITAASLRKPLALQLPGIGQEGEPDRAKFAALEERRRMLLAQAKGGK